MLLIMTKMPFASVFICQYTMGTKHPDFEKACLVFYLTTARIDCYW